MGLLSYSQLNTLNHCGEQLRLQKLGFPEPPAVYLIGGTAFHEASEEWDRQYEVGGRVDPIEVWHKHWKIGVEQALLDEPDITKWRVGGRASKANPDKEGLAFWGELGQVMMADYAKWRGECDWEIYRHNDELAIEIAVSARMGAATVRGYLDRIFVTRNGELIIVDHKTGKQPEHEVQLATYAEMVRQTLDLNPQWGCFYMARKGEPSTVANLDNYSSLVLTDMYSKLNTIRRLGLYVPNPGSHCKACGVAAGCSLKGDSVVRLQWAGLNPEF